MLIRAWWDMRHSHLLDWNPSVATTPQPGSLRLPHVTRFWTWASAEGVNPIKSKLEQVAAGQWHLFQHTILGADHGRWTWEGVPIIRYPSWRRSGRFGFQFLNDIIFSLCTVQQNPNYTKLQLCPQKLVHFPTAISRLFLKEAFTSAGY